MADVEFIPNDPAPSDAEKTQYNVFTNDGIDREFVGYIALDWMGYWSYYIDGQRNKGYADRCDLFALIKDDPHVRA